MTNAVSADLGKKLYCGMLRIRRFEERIKAMYHQREMRSPPHLCMGHEAVAVGVCAALERRDVVFPYYRSHGWYLAKGGDLNAMMAELFGRASGCSRGWGGSMHLIDLPAGVMGTSAIVARPISHAAGAALTLKTRRHDSPPVGLFRHPAPRGGAFPETRNLTPPRKPPLAFFFPH